MFNNTLQNETKPQEKCVAWVEFNGVGAVSISDSYNISSITDLATGRYRLNLSITMANANYAVAGCTGFQALNNPISVSFLGGSPKTTTNCTIQTGNGTGRYDADPVSVVIFGDI